MTSLTFLTAVAVDPNGRTKKEVLVDRMPLTNEWTDICVMLESRSGYLAVTLHSQSTRKRCCYWTWKRIHRSKWRISIIIMEFFGDPIVPDGKISGTAGSSSGSAGYVRKTSPCHPWGRILTTWTISVFRNYIKHNIQKNISSKQFSMQRINTILIYIQLNFELSIQNSVNSQSCWK